MRQQPSNRIQAVVQATETWRKNLVDTTGRNRLRRYRDLKTGTLDLTPGIAQGLDARIIDRLIANRTVKLSDLLSRVPVDPVGSPPFDEGRRRLAAIQKTALTNSEEKGIETLFAAVGIATWEVASGSEPYAPVILVPLKVEATGAAARDFSIRVAGDAHLNPVLAHILRTEHDIGTNEDEADVAEEPPRDFNGYLALLNRMQQSWDVLPNLVIEPRVIVAIFSYSTMPLVADLEINAELFAESDIVAAIAGDAGARSALANRIRDPDPNRPDTDPPSEEFLVLDADSSQHMAINRVLSGESLVIQGPPGTGKSQTIANLIAALIARGKRILFVAEKRAAIEAVTKRLEHVGLIDLVLDLHGGITSRRDFARTLNDSLKQVSQIPAHDFSDLHTRLHESRDSLTANDAAVHDLRSPWGLSVFEMRTRLLSIPESAQTQISLKSEDARTIDREQFDRLEREMVEWTDLGGHSLHHDHPEWSRSGIKTIETAHKAFELVSGLAQIRLPAARETLFSALDELRLPKPESLEFWIDTTRFLTIASGSWWTRMMAQIFSRKFRKTKQALGASSPLSLAQDRAGKLQEDAQSLVNAIDELKNVAVLDGLDELSIENLGVALERMASNRTTVANLPRIRELEKRFIETGIADVTERIGEDIPPEYAARAVEHAWIRRVLDDLEFEDRRLAAFDGSSHSRHLEEFIQADCQHRDSTAQRVRRLVAEAIIATMNEHPDETLIVRREAAKKSRHLSVRQLFARAPHVLSTLRPCWTMSPILAAEMIPADLRLFDIVVFDEASQIPPAEAIGCLARAPQSVIAGDSRQLPPTSFFGRNENSDDDLEDDSSLTNDIESLLDAADVLLRDQMLQWHYRSRDDRLIAFSNVHIYGGALTAFPGATVLTPISHCLVPFRPHIGVSGTRSNPDEVEKVVDLVLEHAIDTPSETLGVIAFGQHHADNIENVLMRRLSQMNNSSLDDFFSVRNEERFFVKNIERVQGDERDAIILSVGYHKDANGNLPYRFGPILQEGGERRLNVAVTRARSRLTLVSSFSHRDMDPGRSSAKGVELLRQYLEYAASGGDRLGGDVIDVPLNPFELSVKDGLERRGIPVTPQYGVSGYRIDFACAHPDEPGRMVLAVEADGASYHSVPTVRDRDRLRQQVLESKGWRFHRIWSTAWARDREAELDKAEQSWKQAVDAAQKDEPLPSAAPPARTPQNGSPTPQRGPRPEVPNRSTYGYDNITDYTHSQLVSLAQWIQSDTFLRTEDELIREMMSELGFKRSGARINHALKRAIEDPRI